MVGVALARRGVAPGGAAHHRAQRAAAIDARVRCPSCDGISVADSSASTAVAIRQAVAPRATPGQSDGQIDAFLVSRYGPGILLRPPAHGATAWVWVLPPVAVAVAAVAVGTVFWRRRCPPRAGALERRPGPGSGRWRSARRRGRERRRRVTR